jgi:hypothetical protein
MKIIIIAIIFFSATLCGFSQKNRGASYTYEVSCLGTELDGSITVESFGMGRNKADASEQAKKNIMLNAELGIPIRLWKSRCKAAGRAKTGPCWNVR